MKPEEIEEAVARAVDARVAPLTEANTKLTADLEEANTRAARAEEALLGTAAKAHITEALAKVQGLPKVTTDRLAESLAANPPATDGKLDTAKLDEALKVAVDAEVKYLAEATGSPVRGAGGEQTFTTEEAAAATSELESAFGRLGMSETAAKTAAAGRGR